jgi:type IV secretion system protein VirB3
MDHSRNAGIVADVLFVGMTRPSMKWGVTYSAFIVNVVLTMEAFILTKNLAWLLACVPIHGLFYLICLYEPRFFDLLQLWGRTRFLPWCNGTIRFWQANSYSPLCIDLPDARGRRRSTAANVFLNV